MEAPRERTGSPVVTWPSSQVHVEWGRAGLEQAAARGDGIVIVDVLSFSTLVTLVTERGASVCALAPEAITELGGRAAVAERFGAHVAGETRDDVTARVTLSPASAVRVEAGDRLVIPSLNGGTLTSKASSAPFAIVGCLRNCVAVGRFVAAALRLALVERVTIVAAGEQWKGWIWARRARARPSFMAHHQGMSLLSLAYLLLDRPMQKRFESDPLFQATTLLLQERIPKATAFYSHTAELSDIRAISSGPETPVRVSAAPTRRYRKCSCCRTADTT